MLYYLVIARLEDSKHPFFQNNREYFEAYVEDKVEKKNLGRYVATKMAKDISELARENENLREENKRLKHQKEELDKIKAVCEKKGISTFYRLDEKLEEALSQRASDRVIYQVDKLIEQAKKVKELLC